MNKEKIENLEKELLVLRKKYAKLPQKSSFSGWAVLDEIDSVIKKIYEETSKKD